MLDARIRALLDLAAAIGTRRSSLVQHAAARAAADAAPDDVEELLLQSHLFVGFPDAMSAIAAWRQVSGRSAPEPLQESDHEWAARGQRVCAAVYAGNYPRLRANVAALHPEMDRWMVEGGYGRVLGRPGMDLATRELCIVALLGTWGAPRQLHAHLRGALNVGASAGAVQQAVAAACRLLPADAAAEVQALWDGIRSRAEAA